MSKSAPPQPSIAPTKADPAEVRSQLVGKHVCPFCGVMRADPAQPCPRCTLDDTVATRSATKQRIGPWFVLQARNPSAPGMKLGTLQSLIRKGHLTPRSVVRGPTTDQMWAFAATVRGLSREFGLCFHCGEGIDPTETQCPHCGRGQLLPADSDALLENPTPAAGPFAPPAPLSPPIPPADFLSAASVTRSDTGMDGGGTSLDLQADHPFAITPPADPRPQRPAQLPGRQNVVQRAPAPAKEEAILSARELAAAFQLDFKQPNGSGRANRPRRPVRTLAALLLIVVIAGGIVLALRPDWRQTSFAWANEKWGTVTASLEKPSKPADSVSSPTASRTANPPSAPSPKPTPAHDTPKPAASQTPVTPTPSPTANQTPPVETPKVETPPPPKLVVQTPPPAPVAVQPTPTPPPQTTVTVPNVPEDITVDQATDLASDMRLKAIDAQARNDWAGALKLYEQIQKLPRDAWPSDLSMRMDVARKRVNGQ